MVLVESYCPSCGAACNPVEGMCAACGTSLKITRPLSAETTANSSALNLTTHLQAQQLFRERYQIMRQVGVGGFGAVYEAEDTQEQRRVAIKEIGLAGLTPQQMIEATGSFNREVELLTLLHHQSIPRIYEHLRDDEHWYVVMDFIDGQTLEERLTQTPGGRLPMEQALTIAIGLCDVLDYLHTHQPPIIFRDLKPANVILRPNQPLTLIDFGVARRYASGKPKDTIAFGSPGYAAPEQYGRAQTTPRSDIYSLGALLHQMLTGQDPSLNPFRFQALSGLPLELEKLVTQMLETDMMQRPKNIAEVKRRLQAIAASRIVTQRRKAGSARGTKGARPPLASAATLARTFSTIGVTVAIYRGHTMPVNALSWSPDGKAIASCADRSGVSIWNAFQPSIERTLSSGIRARYVSDLAWSPTGQELAVANSGNAVWCWRMSSQPGFWETLAVSLGFRGHSYTRHAKPVTALSWSPDGQMIASAEKARVFDYNTGREASAIHVWNTRTNKCWLIYKKHTHGVEGVAWAPDGSRIASCSVDRCVRIWDADDGNDLWFWRPKNITTHTLAWSPDARYLACGTEQGRVHVWDTLKERQAYTCHGHKGPVYGVAWSPDGQRIASAGYDGLVHVWNAQDGQELFIYQNHDSSIFAVAWSPDGQHIASAGEDGQVHVWKTT